MRPLTEEERGGRGCVAAKSPNLELSKVEQYGWKFVDKPGEPANIPKEKLHVDTDYQRDDVKMHRVLDIARNWSWFACGCLIIARRPNGLLFVVDGQHRKLAADKRADVRNLPCLVFDVEGSVSDEALAFIRVNASRAPVGALGKFKADILAEDATAIAVKQMVESSGYSIAKSTGTADFTVACVGLLKNCVDRDPILARDVWNLCVSLCGGQQIVDRLYGPMFELEKELRKKKVGSLFEKHNIEALERTGVTAILQKVNGAKIYYGKGGNRIGAQGIIELLNQRRKTRRLPDMGSAVSGE